MPPFCTDHNTWLTNNARLLVCDQHTNLKKIVDCKVLHFINNEDQEALGYKTLRRTRNAARTFSSVGGG